MLDPVPDDAEQGGLSEQQKRDNVVRLAFGGDRQLFDAFCREIEAVIPAGTTVVLRGSAVTGSRWRDGASFDADGPGTSDLDITLVGADAVKFFKVTGFFVPDVHSRPLSDEDPDIAPRLVPLRKKLMAIVHRPVNVQASREIVIQFRGDLLGQPYLTLFETPDSLSILSRPERASTLRLLTYNVRNGGVGRAAPIARVIASCEPDIVLLQEATRPEVVADIAARTGMADWRSFRSQSLAFLSRTHVPFAASHRPRFSRHAFLEVAPGGEQIRLFGVHLSALHAAWTERRRLREVQSLLRGVAQHQHGLHVLAGDFNTVAPPEDIDVARLPMRLRPFVWLSGGRIRWRVVQTVLDAGYVDAYRAQHALAPGHTMPAWDPHVRLDYVFVPQTFADRVEQCDVVDHPDVRAASDHLPVLAVLRVA
jgi:exodeoxyribonuclease-3